MGAGSSHCEECTEHPIMRCSRCTTGRCGRHRLSDGERCDGCERDWADEDQTRRSAKMIFAPPAAVLAGGMLFGLLLPALGGMIGAAFLATFAIITAFGTGIGACRVVDRSARALFLRERSGGLPPARLLPAPRHR